MRRGHSDAICEWRADAAIRGFIWEPMATFVFQGRKFTPHFFKNFQLLSLICTLFKKNKTSPFDPPEVWTAKERWRDYMREKRYIVPQPIITLQNKPQLQKKNQPYTESLGGSRAPSTRQFSAFSPLKMLIIMLIWRTTKKLMSNTISIKYFKVFCTSFYFWLLHPLLSFFI